MRKAVGRKTRIAFGCLVGLLVVHACGPRPSVKITSPAHGIFTLDTSITVSGTIANIPLANARVTVNGAIATINPDATWSVTVPVDPGKIMNPYLAVLRNLSTNQNVARARVLVHYGESIADGQFSDEGVALRLTDPGLDQVEPIIESGVDLDLASLVPPGTVVISNYCAISAFGLCVGRVTARVASSPPPSTSGFAIDVDSQTNLAYGDVDVYDLSLDLDLDGSGLAPDCGWHFDADVTQITGDYTLQPDTVDASNIDVNLVSTPGVTFVGFDDQPTWGLCDFPLIGDLIQLIIGDLQPTVRDSLRDYLKDPDGAGPVDAPVADAIETALGDISITGPLSESLGVVFEAPLFDVIEDVDGITLGSDTRITSSVGTGAGQCTPPTGSPDLAASYHVAETFPTFGTTTPVGALPYHLGLGISTSAFNQLLKSQVECGLLRTSITEIDLGEGPVALTAGVLSLLIPEFQVLLPETPLRIDLLPSLSPLISGNAGPGGELAELQVPHLVAEIRSEANYLYLQLAIDFKAGLGITFDGGTSSLVFSVESVAASDIEVAVVKNAINTSVATLQNVLPGVLEPVLPTLGDGLGAFPLPSFLGLQLSLVEVSRNGQFYSLFTNLTPAP